MKAAKAHISLLLKHPPSSASVCPVQNAKVADLAGAACQEQFVHTVRASKCWSASATLHCIAPHGHALHPYRQHLYNA